MFDENKFSKILKEIISQYDSISSFAEKSSLDRTYISKYVNKKLEHPPSPDILKKIANNSNGITNYIELMKICDYLDENMEDKMAIHSNEYDKIEQLVREKIYNLETENADLKQQLALAQAKLEIYERIDSITNRDISIGFGPLTKN